jgi:hypothetical protein
MLSALPTDPAFGAITRRYNGLPAWKMVGGYAKMLASPEDKLLAVRAGLIAEEWATMTAAQHRIFAEEMGNEVSKRLAAGVLRASGLAAYTQAGRWAFGMEFLSHLTGLVSKSFDELDPRLARAMKRHGLTRAIGTSFAIRRSRSTAAPVGSSRRTSRISAPAARPTSCCR